MDFLKNWKPSRIEWKPSLIIGIGSTGSKVVKQLRKNYGSQLDLFKFILVDTEKNKEEDETITSALWLKDKEAFGSISTPIKELGNAINRQTVEYMLENPDQLYKVSPQYFELLIEEIFKGLGYRVEKTKQTRDGGVDMYVEKHIDGMLHRYAVQCKYTSYKGRKQSIGPIRDFLGAITGEKVTAGIFINNTFFSKDAFKFLKKHIYNLFPIDLAGLLNLLRRYLIATA